MEKLSKRYPMIDESRQLPKERLDRVVRQVNNMSKQMLSDIGVRNVKKTEPVQNYLQSLVAVSEPTLLPQPSSIVPFEYQQTRETESLIDLKRKQRHENSKQVLK